MRVLLDECLPRRLKHHLPGHEVRTVPEEGWAGKKIGDLLRLAVGRFAAFVTVDRGQMQQQDIRGLPLAVLVLRARSNRLESLLPLVPPTHLCVSVTGSVPGKAATACTRRRRGTEEPGGSRPAALEAAAGLDGIALAAARS